MSEAWPLVRLDEVLTPIRRPTRVEPSKAYPILGAHWYAKGLYVKAVKQGAQIRASELFRVEAGDFVYNRLFAWKGAFALAEHDNHNCYASNEFPCFSVNSARLDGYYLWRYFSCSSTWVEALSLSSGATSISRNRLKVEQLLGIKVPLPPIAEQRRIVARIEDLAMKVADAKELRNEALVNAKALAASYRAGIFAEQLKISTLPLSRAAVLERGKFSHRPRNDPRFFGGEHPWIQIGEIEAANKYIKAWSVTLNDAGLQISRKFPKGTVLISIAATIGAVGILDFDCCVPDSVVALTPSADFESEYIYHYLSYLRTDLEKIAPQSAQKNINLKILADIPIPVISLDEQHRVINTLNNMGKSVSEVKEIQQQTAGALDGLLPAILDKAFKGEL